MPKPPRVIATGLATLALLFTGLAGPAGSAGSAAAHAGPERPIVPAGVPAAPIVPAGVPAPARAHRAPGNPKPCTNQDMSGCYAYHQTKDVADYSIKYAARAVNVLYPGLPQPTSFWYIPQGRAYRWCGGTMTDASFGYCFTDRTMALGQRQLWEFYDRAGDAAPLVGVAHEYAHHIQLLKGVRPPRTARESVRFENQADCLAGAIVRQLRREGIFTDQDLSDVDELIPLIASAEGSERDHGTLSERVDAIYLGIRYGARSCSRYVPGGPLVG